MEILQKSKLCRRIPKFGGLKMGMSKKHYEMIASVISLNKGRDSIIAGLASKFVNDNPRFDEDKFKEACRK